jgi:hypothetical protein
MSKSSLVVPYALGGTRELFSRIYFNFQKMHLDTTATRATPLRRMPHQHSPRDNKHNRHSPQQHAFKNHPQPTTNGISSISNNDKLIYCSEASALRFQAHDIRSSSTSCFNS